MMLLQPECKWHDAFPTWAYKTRCHYNEGIQGMMPLERGHTRHDAFPTWAYKTQCLYNEGVQDMVPLQ